MNLSGKFQLWCCLAFHLGISQRCVFGEFGADSAKSHGGDHRNRLFSRFDRDSYFATRNGEAEGRTNEKHRKPRDSSRTKRAKRRRTKYSISNKMDAQDNTHKLMKFDNFILPITTPDDPRQCTIYLAPSSIPDSGLGMYTAVPYQKGQTFPIPEIAILLQDPAQHDVLQKFHSNLLSQYPWAAQVLTNGHLEVHSGEAMVPGLGMLANSHLGLVNARQLDYWKMQPFLDGTDSLSLEESRSFGGFDINGDGCIEGNDVGRGAYSSHSRVVCEAQTDIQAGEELFVNYGDGWFLARDHMLGPVAGAQHFHEADVWLASFFERMKAEGGHYDAELRKREYGKLLEEAASKQDRFRAAFPDDVEEVPDAITVGTARFSAKESIQSEEFLQRNGACIDNIIAGKSTIPQAGRGAFATRSIEFGERVSTTPVLTLDRDQLILWKNVEDEEDENSYLWEEVGQQLLVNYCYGHPNSSLVFFPYSPTVNFFNHGGSDRANAEIRWSTLSSHKSEWIDTSLDETKARLKTGLIFDIVAKRDIRRGEEILLDYGRDWENSWKSHIEKWSPLDGSMKDFEECNANLTKTCGNISLSDLNARRGDSIVRTVEEQVADPYPTYVRTMCLFNPPDECLPNSHNTANERAECELRWKLTLNGERSFPCEILSRDSIDGKDWYSARIEVAIQN
ncbi:hypothetical protein ACHAXS_008404, partial [Conticribra weissflogii]